MTISLRPYQGEAVAAVYQHLRQRGDNPCVVIPTAGGKTPVMSTICCDAVEKWGGRVLVLAHVKELLQQTAKTLRQVAPNLDVGIYSAGLNSRDTDHAIIVAGIQSVYRRAGELDAFDLVMVDEAHLIPPSGEGMYQQFLAEAKVVNPNVRFIGLTATPYRMSSGIICGPEGEKLLNHVCYEVGVKELIAQGYLCPLRSRAGKVKANLDNLHIRGGEFIASEVEATMDCYTLVNSACDEIVELTRSRRSVLIFTSGVKHGRHVASSIERVSGEACGFVCGDTPGLERKSILQRFKTGELKYLANVNVLTTGFDAPNIDCVAMLRPTNSPGLYYQMVGRGFRLHADKADCLVLDFGGNILRHGPVDDLQIKTPGQGSGEAPAKECPKCQALIHAAYATCPECDYEFPPPKQETHQANASNAGILSGQVTDSQYDITDTAYYIHTKRGADESAPKTMRIDYQVGWNDWQSEWVCPEHTGYARSKFEAWWRARCRESFPGTAQAAVAMAEAGCLAQTKAITVRSVAGGRSEKKPFDRIVGYELGEIPPRQDGSDECDGDDLACPNWPPDDDEIPF